MKKRRINHFANHYYADIARFLGFAIPRDAAVLHVGADDDRWLQGLHARRGVAVALTTEDARLGRDAGGDHTWIALSELGELHETFDYIILPDVLGRVGDVQTFIQSLLRLATPRTRFIVTNYSRLWQPLLRLAEWLGAKVKEPEQNWLSHADLANLLALSDCEIVKTSRRLLLPLGIPLLNGLCNRVLVHLPIIRHLALYNVLVARPGRAQRQAKPSISVVIPARNEAGNIENAVKRIPELGAFTELIFIEGGSTDNTWDVIQEVQRKYGATRRIKIGQQDGRGKNNAVVKGFGMAEGDILTIVDADLTMPPEELPKFYHALVDGTAEFANGSRLVYPLEKSAMRFFNILGNHFFALAFSWLLDQRLKDTLCGTKTLWRDDYERLDANRDYFGDFDPFGDFDLIFGAARLNLKIRDIPIHYKAREYGDTNISRWRHGVILLRMTLFALRKIKFI